MRHQSPNAPSAVELPCACANLRRAARIVTQLYDQELRGAGLRAAQFTLLQVLARSGRITQGDLGGLLAIDSTTLSRTLRLLVGKGWVRGFPGEDRRERHFQLTPAGHREFNRARPNWERAQQRLRKALGDTGWERLQADLLAVTGVVRGA